MNALEYFIQSGEFKVNVVPIPEPGSDDIRIKCLATALNPVDAKVNNWKGMLDASMSTIHLGLDVCGVVDAVGENVTNFHIGDFVLYHGCMSRKYGGFAEYAIHDALTTVKIADRQFDPVLLASSPCAAWTAHRALFDQLGIPQQVTDKDTSIVIVGASGGVGTFAIQFAKLAGFEHIIAVCSKKNEQYVRELGATQVVDYRSETSIHDALQRLTDGQGVDYIMDCVGADTARDAVRSLRYDGKICPVVSFAEGDLPGFLRSITYAQISLGGAHTAGLKPRQRLVATGTKVTNMILSGILKVPLIKVITLEEVADTLKEMLSANTTGKIVLKF